MQIGQQSIYLLLLVIALGFTGWYYAHPEEQINLSPQALEKLPDTIINNMYVIEFDQAGFPSHTLRTPQLIHYPEDNRSYLQKPRIIAFQEEEEPWHIQARHGYTRYGSEVITLKENVILHQPEGETNQESTIKTNELSYFSEQQMAETDQLITLEQPNLFIESIGMRAYMDTEIIQLLDRVRGYHETAE